MLSFLRNLPYINYETPADLNQRLFSRWLIVFRTACEDAVHELAESRRKAFAPSLPASCAVSLPVCSSRCRPDDFEGVALRSSSWLRGA